MWENDNKFMERKQNFLILYYILCLSIIAVNLSNRTQ